MTLHLFSAHPQSQKAGTAMPPQMKHYTKSSSHLGFVSLGTVWFSFALRSRPQTHSTGAYHNFQQLLPQYRDTLRLSLSLLQVQTSVGSTALSTFSSQVPSYSLWGSESNVLLEVTTKSAAEPNWSTLLPLLSLNKKLQIFQAVHIF